MTATQGGGDTEGCVSPKASERAHPTHTSLPRTHSHSHSHPLSHLLSPGPLSLLVLRALGGLPGTLLFHTPETASHSASRRHILHAHGLSLLSPPLLFSRPRTHPETPALRLHTCPHAGLCSLSHTHTPSGHTLRDTGNSTSALLMLSHGLCHLLGLTPWLTAIPAASDAAPRTLAPGHSGWRLCVGAGVSSCLHWSGVGTGPGPGRKAGQQLCRLSRDAHTCVDLPG